MESGYNVLLTNLQSLQDVILPPVPHTDSAVLTGRVDVALRTHHTQHRPLVPGVLSLHHPGLPQVNHTHSLVITGRHQTVSLRNAEGEHCSAMMTPENNRSHIGSIVLGTLRTRPQKTPSLNGGSALPHRDIPDLDMAVPGARAQEVRTVSPLRGQRPHPAFVTIQGCHGEVSHALPPLCGL